jgi:pSer/pThr/pTyr-binding forkhead associated (FHA) protein
MAKLILKFNDAVIDQIEVKPGDMAIGRRPGSDVLLDNLAVSGNHANIFTVGEDSFIQDLESTNGTFINNKKITKHHLKNGDIILIGKHSIIYTNDNLEKASDNFAKTVVINPAAASKASAPDDVQKPAVAAGADKKTAEAASGVDTRQGAIFILSGANSGKRIELTAPVTNLGKTGKPAGTISRKQNSYILSAVKGGEVPKLNGKLVPAQGEELKNGDIIEVGDSRLQFYFK